MPSDIALIGRTLAGRYRVNRFLGEGAMARVYFGSQDGEPQDIAIKVMHPELATDPLFLRRFRREAKAAASLKHPNVVRVLDHGVDGDLAYIVMELLRGTDLFDLLVAEGRLDQARACRILIEVCKALSAAHASGIIHRDLKPENVMLVSGPAGVFPAVKVLDFGIAKVLERERAEDQPSVTSSALTNVGAALGTPEYMSPEQCEGADVDARSDVYTSGAMLYRVLTGRVPFAGAIPLDTMLRHLRDPPTPPSTFVEGIHPGLEAVILKALAKKGDDRQQSADQLAAELAALLPELPTEKTRTIPSSSRRRARATSSGARAPVSVTPVYRQGDLQLPDRPPGTPARRRARTPISQPDPETPALPVEPPTMPRPAVLVRPAGLPRPPGPPRPAPRAPRPAPPAAPAPPAPPAAAPPPHEEPLDEETLQMEPVSDRMADTLVYGPPTLSPRPAPRVPGPDPDAATLQMPAAQPDAIVSPIPSPAPVPSAAAARPRPPPSRARSNVNPVARPPAPVVPVVPLFLITFSVVFVIGMVVLLSVQH